jgi:hypothetical protein
MQGAHEAAGAELGMRVGLAVKVFDGGNDAGDDFGAGMGARGMAEDGRGEQWFLLHESEHRFLPFFAGYDIGGRKESGR